MKSITVWQLIGFLLLCSGVAKGQIIAGSSGIPGDGIPDVYYYPSTGYLHVDTDGQDMVALFIGGADVSTSGCNLCDGMNLPGTDALGESSSWTVGYSAGSTQWIRTDPLSGRGFEGVVAQHFIDGAGVTRPWPADFAPFLDFPRESLGIARYGLFSGFDRVFSNGSSSWEVLFGTDDGRTFYTDVTLGTNIYPPVAEDDFYTTTIGGTIDTLADLLPGLLDNDSSGEPLESLLGFVEPMYGSVTVNRDGSFIYAHDGSNNLADSFTYLARKPSSLSIDEATVIITIVPEPNLAFVFGFLLSLIVRLQWPRS